VTPVLQRGVRIAENRIAAAVILLQQRIEGFGGAEVTLVHGVRPREAPRVAIPRRGRLIEGRVVALR
jgi:hypothetical protein